MGISEFRIESLGLVRGTNNKIDRLMYLKNIKVNNELVEKKSKRLSYQKKKERKKKSVSKNTSWDIKLAIVEETPNVEVSVANRRKSPVYLKQQTSLRG